MITYQHAQELFNNTRKPPRSKKYAENQRPLRRVSESWLMLQQDNHSYAYIINGVQVVRLFEPDEHGNYEVAIRGLYNTNDINLMWKFTGAHNGMNLETTEGIRVPVPLNHRFSEQNKDYSAVLTFNSSHQLVVEKSWHADIYRKESTADDKQKRKDIKQAVDAYVTLQMFKLPTIRANCKPQINMGVPFGEDNLSWSVKSSMQDALRNLPLPEESTSFVQTFDEIAQDCFDMLASKRAYNDSNDYGRSLSMASNHWYARNEPAKVEEAQKTLQHIVESITPEDFKKSLITKLIGLADLKVGSRAVALPQFGKMPRKYYTVG